MARVAVIGTGVIGAGMARQPAAPRTRGRRLEPHSRAQPPTSSLPAPDWRRLPAAAAADADVVFEATADDASSRSVWLGADGIIAGSQPSATLVTSATLSPDWVAELADACRDAGRDVPRHAGHRWPRRRRGRGPRDAGRRRGRRPRGDRRRARGDLVARCATSARWATGRGSSSCSTPCRRSTSSASVRRCDGAGRRSRSRRRRAALVERLGGPVTKMAWAADQQLPERANFALALGAQGPPLRRGDGRRRAGADARRGL